MAKKHFSALLMIQSNMQNIANANDLGQLILFCNKSDVYHFMLNHL